MPSTAVYSSPPTAAATRSPYSPSTPRAATLAGYALDCVWDINRRYHAMCAYLADIAFGNWSNRRHRAGHDLCRLDPRTGPSSPLAAQPPSPTRLHLT